MSSSTETAASAGFGKSFAVLNLDLMTILIDAVKDTPAGQNFTSNSVKWNNAVHGQAVRPLTIFTSLAFSGASQPELAPGSPFAKLVQSFDKFKSGTPQVQIHPHFTVDDKDVVLHKTRWYAGSGNALDQILRANKIDTVVISGLSLSGVVMSTVYRLFDLDYNIFVISDNVLELPVDQTEGFSKVMLDMLLPKMNVKCISLDEALTLLASS